jgi:hypothetical protein
MSMEEEVEVGAARLSKPHVSLMTLHVGFHLPVVKSALLTFKL